MTQHKTYEQKDLNDVLWAAANSARSAVDASVYKDYALTMLFFKYLCDLSKKRHDEYNTIMEYPKESRGIGRRCAECLSAGLCSNRDLRRPFDAVHMADAHHDQ